jgi:hypothetical protein
MSKSTDNVEARCDGELQNAKQEVLICKRGASVILNQCFVSIRRHLPRDYSALENFDPCTGDSDRPYGSDNVTTESESVYTSEPEE